MPLTRDTSYRDAAGRPGMRYRLFGINGFGRELLLGETGLGPEAALAARRRRVPSGVYFLRAKSGGIDTRIKLTVLR